MAESNDVTNPNGARNLSLILRRVGAELPAEDRAHFNETNRRTAELLEVLGDHRVRLDRLVDRVARLETNR